MGHVWCAGDGNIVAGVRVVVTGVVVWHNMVTRLSRHDIRELVNQAGWFVVGIRTAGCGTDDFGHVGVGCNLVALSRIVW